MIPSSSRHNLSGRQWWLKDRPLSIADIEFAVLILRICLYAAQLLPSSLHDIDKISALSLPENRNVCTEVGNSLAKACLVLDWKGSLVRVQHLLFAAIKFSCEGRTDQFWEGIAAASQAAQKAGIQRDSSGPENDSWELEKEMRRRVFCSLYLLDSHLSRQLDRVPFLPDSLVADMLPRMHLVTNDSHPDVDSGAPELFTERLMQVQLARFWRRSGSGRNSEYDPMQAEQRYEQFCAEYLPSLPAAFALKPDTKWDNQIASLAPYKQVLLRSQKKVLAIAALRELEAISALHAMFNGCNTRFGAIIFNTFEASVLLLTLCTHEDFPFDEEDNPGHILGLKVGRLTRKRFIQAAEKGLDRLQLLAGLSDMAEAGARTLAQLFIKVSRDVDSVSPEISGGPSWNTSFSDLLEVNCDTGYPASWDFSNSSLVTEPLSMMAPEDSCAGLQSSSLDLVSPLDFAAPFDFVSQLGFE
ncbi:MAG: hypothetical protein Q9213_000229 [Squamulea squamosa]